MKKPNHERIYLIPGSYDGENCYVWSDDPAPGTEDNPQDAIEYVRADLFKALQAQVDDINRKCSDLIAERDAAFFASRKSAELHAKVVQLQQSLLKCAELVNVDAGTAIDWLIDNHHDLRQQAKAGA